MITDSCSTLSAFVDDLPDHLNVPNTYDNNNSNVNGSKGTIGPDSVVTMEEVETIYKIAQKVNSNLFCHSVVFD